MFKARANGPRCAACGRYFEPRTLRDGSMSKTCGNTTCVSLYQTRRNPAIQNQQARQPRKITSLANTY